MTISVRPLEENDKTCFFNYFDEYLQFYGSELSVETRNETWCRFFDPNVPINAAMAIDEAGKPLGFVTWVYQYSTWHVHQIIYLQDLYVSPKSRNQGAGRKLIEYVYNQADIHGTPKVYWQTQYFNHRAQLLYTKVGIRSDRIVYLRSN